MSTLTCVCPKCTSVCIIPRIIKSLCIVDCVHTMAVQEMKEKTAMYKTPVIRSLQLVRSLDFGNFFSTCKT